MADPRFTKSSHTVYNIKYHLVWCPKYRKPVLVDNVARDLEKLLYRKAKQIGVTLEALEIMPDHVHAFVSSDPTEAPQRIANHLKGFTSRMLRDRYRSLRRMPTLWTRSYYCGSVGTVSEETVKQYIENQRKV